MGDDDLRARLDRLLDPPRRRERVVFLEPAAEVRVVLPPPPPSDAARLVARRLEALRGGAAPPRPRPTVPPDSAPTAVPPDSAPTAAPPATPPAPPPGSAPAAAPPDPGGRSTLETKLASMMRSRGLESAPAGPARLPPPRSWPGLTLRATAFGPAPVMTDELAPDDRHGNRSIGAVLDRPGDGAALLAADAALSTFDVRRALFLDIETTGLAIGMGTLAFLIGVAWFRGDRLVLEQWFLRDPDDEPAVLAELGARLADADHLVTFNGRTFDLPILRARFRLHRMGDPSAGAGHLDLLHAARRMLRHDLPNCRLGTLEPRHLGVFRHDDVSGAEVPARYLGWLRDADPVPVLPVVRHNRDDVLSMVTLLDELLHRVAVPEATLLRDPPCALALARIALRLGALDVAERLYTLAQGLAETRDAADRGLARLRRRRLKHAGSAC